MAQRAFLHVGTMKSGTSFLQSLWWKNHDELRRRGLLLPGGPRRGGGHFHAACLICEHAEVVQRMTDQERRSWDVLVEQTAATDSDVLISSEVLARATKTQADRALARLAGACEEIHVIVTARDLARQLGSAWQQEVKQGSTETLTQFWQRIDREGRDGFFWSHHDLPAILDRWSRAGPPERAHLVVLPPPGGPRPWLWQAVCHVTGVDPQGLDDDADRSNDSLGIAEVEVLRRVHAAMPVERRDLDTVRYVKGYFTRQILTASGSGEPFVLPEEMHEWATEEARAAVSRLRGGKWQVVGQLDDLVPATRAASGRAPDQVGVEEVADVAVTALARQLLRGLDQRDELRAVRAELRRHRGGSQKGTPASDG